MLRKMNNAELAFIALDKTIKAALEVRDTILAKREELAELNNDIQEMLDEIFQENAFVRHGDRENPRRLRRCNPRGAREFTRIDLEPISNSSNMRCPGTTA